MSVTIRSIAKAANVSVATVSRALNNSDVVTDKTRQHILTTAEKLGYIPNSAAKSLKTRHTQIIGYLVSDITNSDYISIARVVEDIVRPQGYNLLLCSTSNQRQQELDYLQMLLSKNIDGLLLNTTGLNDDFIATMNQRIPIVLLNRKVSISNSSFRGDYITTDSYQGSYQLTKYVLSLGHQRIFIIRGPLYLNNSADRYRGFVDAMAEAGFPIGKDYPYLHTDEYTRESGIAAVQKILHLSPPPTAIISHSNMPMLGVLEELHRLRPNISKFFLASYDSLPNIDLMEKPPTTIRFDIKAFGSQAAQSILEHIRDPNLKYREFVFPPTLIPSSSGQ